MARNMGFGMPGPTAFIREPAPPAIIINVASATALTSLLRYGQNSVDVTGINITHNGKLNKREPLRLIAISMRVDLEAHLQEGDLKPLSVDGRHNYGSNRRGLVPLILDEHPQPQLLKTEAELL